MVDATNATHSPHKPAGAKEPLRLRSLDSVRGIAALVVVFHHCLLSIPGWSEDRPALLRNGFSDPHSWIYLTPLRVLVSGQAAVLVFFVLSGLVLAMTFIERDRDRYLPYVVKRITRIWPTFAVALLVSAALSLKFSQTPVAGTSTWFAYTWADPLSASLVFSYLAMISSQIGLDNPMWSLVHEMRISLVFPFLVFLTLARWKTTLVAFVVLSVGTTKIIGLYGSNEAVRSLGMTLEFVFLFVAGIVIATRIRGLRHRLAALSTPAATGIWAVALLVVSFSPESTETINKLSDGGLLVISGGAAALIVTLSTVEGRALSILLGPVPSYLGRISYSLYLIHVIVLAAVVHTFAGYAPVPVLVGLGAIASIPLADLSQRFIEVPTTNFGRRLARRLAA